MNLNEFINYFESLTTAKADFCEKATVHQQQLNAERAPARRWNQVEINVQVEKMWHEVLEQLYRNLKNTITNDQNPDEWRKRLDADGFTDEIDDSIREISFETEDDE